MTIRVAILHPTALTGHPRSGIDTYVRGILRHAPGELRVTLFGAAEVASNQTLGQEMQMPLSGITARCVPVVHIDSAGTRRALPLTARYAVGLLGAIASGKLRNFDVLDFHRMEPAILFLWDRRPKRLVMHQDLSGVVDLHSEIRWQRTPFVYRSLERIVLPTIDQISAVRENSRKSYATRFTGFAGRIELTPTFFDSEAFSYVRDDATRARLRTDARLWLGLAEGTRLLMFVGRLDEAKNPKLAVEALATSSLRGEDVHLVLIGDGALRDEVASLVGSLNLQGRVTMLGLQSKENIRRVMHAADIFVLSSVYEGMPIAVLEALACGLPVVSTDVGEVHNLITEGVNGLLCEGTSAIEFGSRIRLALNQAHAMLGETCANSVEKYRADVVLERTYNCYRRLAGQQSTDELVT